MIPPKDEKYMYLISVICGINYNMLSSDCMGVYFLHLAVEEAVLIHISLIAYVYIAF